jgi:diaminohydroxyphosphoribosylaminopyrimidine deaminase/5-amino-6-(5-phosphoribosylamino)uracil reductase
LISQEDQDFLDRARYLSRLSLGACIPNPPVGAVLVYRGRIIGEGYHHEYGGAHAEVEAVKKVPAKERSLIKKSTLYVSLEPCNHKGKTDACTTLILREKIPRVVIGCLDPFRKDKGHGGMEYLQKNGVEVLYKQNRNTSKFLEPFLYSLVHEIPFVHIKYAQSKDGFIGKKNIQISLSSEVTKRYTHKLRSLNHSILVGIKTILVDNPQLNVRHYFGRSPVILVIDKYAQLSGNENLFSNSKILYFTDENSKVSRKIEGNSAVQTVPLKDSYDVHEFLNRLNQLGIQSMLIEGGAVLLQKFIDLELWNLCTRYTASNKISDGINSPLLKSSILDHTFQLSKDQVDNFCSKVK